MVRILKYTGIAVLTLLTLFFGLVIYPFEQLSFPRQDYTAILIKNISIIDVEKDSLLQHQDVLIRGQLIKAISVHSIKGDKDSKIRTIDGTDQFLVPAFWDMHVHLTRQSPHVAYPEFLRHGITHVRDMRGAFVEHDPFAGVQSKLAEWNKGVENHRLLGPRLHGYTSFAIEGPSRMFKRNPSYFNCATPEDAVLLVRYLAQRGVTLIKLYNNIPREAFFTLMREAKKAGLEVAGHKPVRVSTPEASNAGMKSLEHARFLIWDSFSGSERLRNSPDPIKQVNTQLRSKMLHEHDSLPLKEIFQAFIRNSTWYCPTHLTRKDEAFADDAQYRARYQSINPVLKFISFEDLDAIVQEDTSVLGRKVFREFYTRGLILTGKAYKSGVKILAGSDVPELPGSSLHEELGELSKAGLPNYEVLRTATLYPARYYGLASTYGSIKPGKRADLVILDRNPLTDIKNTGSVAGVIFDGIFIDQGSFLSLKEKIEDRQNSLLMYAKLIWDIMVYMTI
ncbi:amidohydrolase family protein [Telluribacter sp.]|jgi:hypothetical protein|uniref:amidohydrolase family protein n=1 Tax=Telluribacter sp. TaxID=1978767 RepID=UPI002E11918D|nr:amidohydrolase family protein [Telluribacter sp.]